MNVLELVGIAAILWCVAYVVGFLLQRWGRR